MVQLTDLEQKRELRRLVMLYFDTPRLSRGIVNAPEFRESGFTRKQIKQMVWNLDNVGLIHKVRGESSGSVYVLCDDGQLLMDAFDLAVRHLEERGE